MLTENGEVHGRGKSTHVSSSEYLIRPPQSVRLSNGGGVYNDPPRVGAIEKLNHQSTLSFADKQ
jgi:hypothetical protein